jgi:hypothetical protein
VRRAVIQRIGQAKNKVGAKRCMLGVSAVEV